MRYTYIIKILNEILGDLQIIEEKQNTSQTFDSNKIIEKTSKLIRYIEHYASVQPKPIFNTLQDN